MAPRDSGGGMIALLFITDGRDEYHEAAFNSAMEYLPKLDRLVQVDDPDHELGFAGAIQKGWEQILEMPDVDYVFHFEGDFTFNAPVPLDGMRALLQHRKALAQVQLKRQAWNPAERRAGGIVELHPEDFDEFRDEQSGIAWTEHRRYWTTNPCLYPAHFCRLGWPQESESEGKFTHRLLADPFLRFAIWGEKFAPPMVEHIGVERVGVGY